MIDFTKINSLLLIKPSSLGDVVHTLPCLSFIKKQHPHLHLHWLINTQWTPILHGNPYLDSVLPFPRSTLHGLKGLRPFFQWIRNQKKTFPSPDLVLDFQGLLRSALLGKLLEAQTTIGLSDAREGAQLFYDHVIEVNPKHHAIDRYLSLLTTLGIPTDQDKIEFALPRGEPFLDSEIPKNFILLHPFSRGMGKSLTIENSHALISLFGDYPFVLAGRSPHTFSKLPQNALNLINKTTLPQLIWLIRKAHFVISVDSGPMHLASALTDRLLAIHTWSNPLQVGPYNKKAWVWKAGKICRPHEMEKTLPNKNPLITQKNLEEIHTFIRALMAERLPI